MLGFWRLVVLRCRINLCCPPRSSLKAEWPPPGPDASVDGGLVSGLAALPAGQRALVSCEGAFSYLARDAGLSEAYIWPVNAEQQATPQQIIAAIDFVRANSVPAVFCESTVSDAPMQQVVGATGAKFGGTLYVDSLSEADGPVPTYLDMIRHDTDVILGGLTGGKS